MERIGIICEYNPFHNGHIHHLKEIKRMYPESEIVLVMSGYTTQRGDMSLISKQDKTRLALKYGVDLVIELPSVYTLNSADLFAYYSVRALNYAGCNKIVFGSETNDIKSLTKYALDEQKTEINKKIKDELAKGNGYPTALSKALDASFKSNDILGICYIKAIFQINDKIEPISIQRTNDYKDIKSSDKVISAENIRNKLNAGKSVKNYIPDYDETLIKKCNYEKLFELLKYKILTTDLKNILGIDEGLENRLQKIIYKAKNYQELIDLSSSKRFTKSRIKRALMHILLGINKKDNIEEEQFRVLGFNKVGKSIIKSNNNLITKYVSRIRQIEINTSIIYDMIFDTSEYSYEIKNTPIIK